MLQVQAAARITALQLRQCRPDEGVGRLRQRQPDLVRGLRPTGADQRLAVGVQRQRQQAGQPAFPDRP